MKKRLQIQLEHEDHDALKAWASSLGVSVSGAVRMLIRERLTGGRNRTLETQRFLAAAGSLREHHGDTTVSRDHDRVLYGKKDK